MKTAEEIKTLDKEKIKAKIDKNRDEINYWLNGDYPLDVVYMRIRMLSAQNERLIKQLCDFEMKTEY